MAGPRVVLGLAGKLLREGLKKADVMKRVQEKYSGITDALASKVVKKALELQKVSDKTGKPLGEVYKELLPTQSTPGKIAKVGMVAGAPAGAALYAGIDSLANSILEATSGSADNKSAGSGSDSTKKPAKRKSPEGGQTIKENRRVVSETRLNKGGVIKANCGASMKPNRMSRS